MKSYSRLLLIPLLMFISVRAADYFPMKAGNWWKYTLGKQFLSIDSGYMLFSMRKGTILSDGKNIMEWNINFPENDGATWYLADSGNAIFNYDTADYKNRTKIMQHEFPELQTRDTVPKCGGSAKAYKLASYTTNAGTFRSCIAISSDQGRYIFAPDIGVVALEMTENDSTGKAPFVYLLLSLNAYNVGGLSKSAYSSEDFRIAPSAPALNINGRTGTIALSRPEPMRVFVYNADGKLLGQMASSETEYVDISSFLHSSTGMLLIRILMHNTAFTRKLSLLH